MLDSLWARARANLIHDLRCVHRYWSLRLSAIGAALSAAWAALPADLREAMPGTQWIGLVLFLAIALARIVDQSGKRP